jgi:hypothetical protein
MLISLWLKMERGEFPFTIEFVTKIAYVKRNWGSPFIALAIVTVTSLVIYYVRSRLLTMADGTAGHAVENGVKKMGILRKIRSK